MTEMNSPPPSFHEKDGTKEQVKSEPGLVPTESLQYGIVTETSDQLHRRLGNRQVQLIAIGGSIGTATFVTIGTALAKGGPGCLLLAYMIYSGIIALCNNCMAEMAVFMPISSPFIRMAGHWVDPALGFMAGWNFFIYEAINIPFEISAISLILQFWRDDIPVAAVVAACIVLYIVINIVAVKYYGEAEFYLAMGKVLLTLIVYMFTFVTMVGGNSKHDAYGFRYWNKPGAFAEFLSQGDMGRFEGFLACIWNAAFTVVGPEYVSMVAGETKYPRKYLKTAFKTTYARFAFFFVGAALCVGIVVPYNDPTLYSLVYGASDVGGTGAASPYVIAMRNLGVEGLPHLTNALLITSIFSAGNAYVYCGSRSLYGLALEGQAPAFLKKCTKSGVPIYCLAVTMCFSLLAFLNVSSASAQVLSWFTNVITGAGLIDYVVITTTYIFFYKACNAQGLDRATLPYRGRFQPYSAWIGLTFVTTVVLVYGYSVFKPGAWDIKTFFTYYTMVLLDPCLYLGWKLVKRTKIIKAKEADLVWEKPAIDQYEAGYAETSKGVWRDVLLKLGLGKKGVDEESDDR